MQFYTSYFYNVRFLPPNVIPLSTAKWPPKWWKRNGKWYIDKRGVINGLEIPQFAPGRSCDNLCSGRENCGRPDGPASCGFLRAYRRQLDALDFEDIMKRFSNLAERIFNDFGIDGEPIFVLLVHEAPDNPCSERIVIQEWFEAHGISCKEYKNIV